MARLIDADVLFKAIKSDKIAWRFGVPNTLKIMFDYIKIIINEQPTVDAVPVAHGRWLYDSGSVKHFCSACDENALSFKKDTLGLGEVWEVCLTDYCPNCGAKMDLKE